MTPALARIADDLGTLVRCESPSTDVESAHHVVDVTRALAESWLADPGRVVTCDGRPHLTWNFGGGPRVLMLGHLDTVWPLGTIERWAYAVEGDRATGPGIFDMKAGVVQLFVALSQLASRDHVSVLLTTDEEIGSTTSRALIEEAARAVTAVLVLEPSADGALKLERKGVSTYQFTICGRAAHAGLEPEAGVNAITEAAHLIFAASAQSRPHLGTTVTPTLIRGGSAVNTVPSAVTLSVDVRAATEAEQTRVDRYFRGRTPTLDEATVTIEGGVNRPPLERSRSERLFAIANEVAAGCGLAPLRGVEVGGGSDGNLTAGIGVDTLDGLGAVGAHAHAEGEWASLGAIAERAGLVAALVDRLRAAPG